MISVISMMWTDEDQSGTAEELGKICEHIAKVLEISIHDQHPSSIDASLMRSLEDMTSIPSQCPPITFGLVVKVLDLSRRLSWIESAKGQDSATGWRRGVPWVRTENHKPCPKGGTPEIY